MYMKIHDVLSHEIERIRQIDKQIRDLENSLKLLNLNMPYEFNIIQELEGDDFWNNYTTREESRNNAYQEFNIMWKDTDEGFHLMYSYSEYEEVPTNEEEKSYTELEYRDSLINAPANLKIIAVRYFDEFIGKYIENVKRVISEIK